MVNSSCDLDGRAGGPSRFGVAIFSLDAADIGPDSSLETVGDWDSLQHVNLVMALEQEFTLRINVVDAVEMTSFPAVCEMLSRYLEHNE